MYYYGGCYFRLLRMNILAKLAMNTGMNPYVHTAYRQIFATTAIAPVAYFLERNSRPAMTKAIFMQLLLSSLIGATLNQVLYLVGLKYSSATEAVAIYNLTSAFTYVLAVVFRLERFGIKKKYGQAKLMGTVISIGGAMLLSLYLGPQIFIESQAYTGALGRLKTGPSSTDSHRVVGILLLLGSTLAGAIWFIIQTKLGVQYPVPYMTSAWICFLAAVQCIIIAVAVDRRASTWSLFHHPIRAVSAIYAGVVCSAMAFCGMAWCIQQKGPLYVSVYSPFQLVIVGVLGWIILNEIVHLGIIIGSVFILIGLYLVLWGKKKEEIVAAERDPQV